MREDPGQVEWNGPTRIWSSTSGLEKHSDHFIAQEILRQAENRRLTPANIENIQINAKGLIGDTDSRQIKIGSADLLSEELRQIDSTTADRLSDAQAKHSCVYLGADGKLAAVFIFGDALRAGAQSAIEKLRKALEGN